MSQAFWTGFIRKCASLNVDPFKLIKKANHGDPMMDYANRFGMGLIGDVGKGLMGERMGTDPSAFNRISHGIGAGALPGIGGALAGAFTGSPVGMNIGGLGGSLAGSHYALGGWDSPEEKNKLIQRKLDEIELANKHGDTVRPSLTGYETFSKGLGGFGLGGLTGLLGGGLGGAVLGGMGGAAAKGLGFDADPIKTTGSGAFVGGGLGYLGGAGMGLYNALKTMSPEEQKHYVARLKSLKQPTEKA